MHTPKQYLIVSTSGRGPALQAFAATSDPDIIPGPAFQPGRLPLTVAASPYCKPLFPGQPKGALFVPLVGLPAHAFWYAGKFRLAPLHPDGRPPHKCLPLVLCYERARREPPQPDEVDRVIGLLEGEILPGEAFAFGVQAATLRAAARDYFAGW